MPYTSHVLTPFGWPVVIYLTLAGVAAGSGLVSAWRLWRDAEANRRPAVRGLGLAALTIAAGSAALIADLEAPGRFGLILTHFNPASMIAWGARIITFFGILCVVVWAILRREPEAGGAVTPGMKAAVGLLALLALAVGLYPGWVLLQAAARPLWDSLWIAPLFLTSALHTGLAAALLLDLPGNSRSRQTVFAPRFEMFLVISQAILLLLWFQAVRDGYVEAAQRITSGELAPWLWGGVVILGWLAPLALAMSQQSRAAVILRATTVLAGGLALRTIVVFGGQGSAALLASTP